MSMLAERKRKQRWSLNPRGKAWLEDKNGFGQKMLEKMGWKHGKGLGANEQGLTESLKVSYKNDNKGMGFKDIEGWTEHDQNFSSFLGSLNGSLEQVEDEIKVGSLEKKVQNCKARINYHKFTKAKDLSRYSEKDLANIFGKKSLKENKQETEVEVSQESMGSLQDVDGDMLVNKGSMADYFRKKMPDFGKAAKNTREIESESENERVGFGFKQAGEDTSSVSEEKKKNNNNKRKYFESFFPHFEKSSEEAVDEHTEKKKRKKNSMMGNFISYIYENSEETKIDKQEIQNCEENVMVETLDCAKPKKKSKKSKINREESRNKDEDMTMDKEEVIDNLDRKAQNEICDNQNKKKLKKLNNANDIEENSKLYQEEISLDVKEDKKQKKSKKKSKEERVEENVLNDKENKIDETIEVVTKSSKKDKKSKSLKMKSQEIHEDARCSDFEALNNVIEDESKKDNKKSKIKKKIQEDANSIDFETLNNIIEDESKKDNKKSKLKKKNQEIKEDADCINSETLDNVIEDESKKVNKKSKLKKKSQEIQEDIDFIDSGMLNNGVIQEIEDESKNDVKQKKPKKSKKHEENGIDNAAFSDYAMKNEETTEERIDSKHSIKKLKKCKKKKLEENDTLGISNLGFDDLSNSNSVSNVSLQEDFEETPRKKKKKKIKEKGGFDNPTFNIAANDTKIPQNRFELRTEATEKGGLDNPALNLSDPIMDCDLMLNIVDTPVILKKPVEKFALNSSITKLKSVKSRRKSVRFSDVLQEHIIPNDPTERINEYISNRNELFDINTMVIEEGLKEEFQKQGIAYENGHDSSGDSYDSNNPKELNKKVVESSVKEEINRGLNSEHCGFINSGFDIRSIDKINFLNDKYEVKSSPSNEDGGIDNKAFNKLKNEIEENVENISNQIERCQAEVENDINESKANRIGVKNWLVGDVGCQIDENVKVEEGLKLCFKEMHFRTPVPHYLKANVSRSKKSYRHLIRGDITVAFKNSNLHEIKGYAVKTVGELRRP